MSKSKKIWRNLLLSLPILAISIFAVVETWAATSTIPVTPGIISTTSMSDYTSYPSGVNALAAPNVPPLIMLVMSRDEQLFNKAYPDYTDLNGDGIIDTTYLDAFSYNGYFDPNICYTYNTNVFAAATAVISGGHTCATGNQYWSGNFLNWISMSRLDVLRWTFYGGTRSTDTTANTVLERAEIPNDLHAWAKVYTGSDIASLAPFTGTTSFCNVSSGKTGGFGTPSQTSSGITSTPLIRTASGSWGDWASTAKVQCQLRNQGNDGDSSRPSGTVTDYTARVQVCQNNGTAPNESFCVADGASLKPEGLLQQYSKNDSNVKRFGLVSGSAYKARLGGQLRRNIGQLANNVSGTACAAGNGAGDGDEFSNVDGTFCYKTQAASEGIVLTLDRLQVTGWNGSDYGDSYGTSGDTTCHGASTPWGARGYLIQATPTMCPDFGNPLAGMYAQALRYIQGAGKINGETSALPNPSWVDPYGTASGATKPRNLPCASCSIVLVSSGLNSFDYASGLPSVNLLNPTSLTNSVQTSEGISGQYQLSTYFNSATHVNGEPGNGSLTRAGTNYSDIAVCAAATIGNLSDISGVCSGTPGQQGSYLISGLSYGAWTIPIRTDPAVVSGFKVKTFGVSLSDNLPSFNISTGATTAISIAPSCRADPAGNGTYTSCYIGSVKTGAQQSYNTTTATGYNTYGLVPSTTYPNVGSFYFVWEDSQYGSDHDEDANNVVSYCIGTSCNLPSTVINGGVAICDPVVINGTTSGNSAVYGGACNASTGRLTFLPGSNDLVIRNQVTGYSSGGMSLGYLVTGTTADGLTEFRITNGGGSGANTGNGAIFNCNLLGNVDCKSSPQIQHFTLSNGAPVPTLQTPLWYAAKYSGYNGTAPTLAAGQDPPNYFFARNAGALKAQLNTVFQAITSAPANDFGNATTPSSSNDIAGNGLSYQVAYFQQRNGVNWTGGLQAFWSDSSGFLREGKSDGAGNNYLDNVNAKYVVSGPDRSTGALPNALTTYRCSVAPVATGSSPFDPSTSTSCSVISSNNLLIPAWDGTTLLNAYYDPALGTSATANTNLTTQRSYSADASITANIGQRYIFTYVTKSPNGSTDSGTVTNGVQTDFVWTGTPNLSTEGSICPGSNASNKYKPTATSGICGDYNGNGNGSKRRGNFGLLNEKSPALTQKLVNWVRGVEDTTDYRSRTSSTLSNTYRLGDIVNSSPTIVGTPAESYDLLYGDKSYSAFRSTYQNRRQMVYTGANDGMLHAFNSGFYVPGVATDGTTAATNPTIYRQLPVVQGTTGDSAAPQGNNWALGQEAWAYVPENLLPHLRWIADKGYTHVFYVDGAPVVSDVQIFPKGPISTSTCATSGSPSSTDTVNGHVCGWGTVMVVPFRLGGGPIQVDTVGDGKSASTQSSDSAYVILDITDPEQPPSVLGEITTGTFTLGAPAFAVHRESDGNLHFLLTLGSGPADNGGPGKTISAPTSSYMSVQVYDLSTIVASNGSTPVASFTGSTGNGPANTFASDMIASDFDLNYSSEAVYFGAVTNPPISTQTAPKPQIYGGSLWKVDMNTGRSTSPDTSDPSTWKLTQVINVSQPVTIRPSVTLDSNGRKMVYFGTGRSYTTDDDSGTSAQGTQQQNIYGVSDNSLLANLPASCQAMPIVSSLFNASATTVSSGTGGIVSGTGISTLSTAATLSDLEAALMATSPPVSPATVGCYTYSGWKLALAAGNTGVADGTNVQKPSERVVSAQTLFDTILLTPTYVPPSAAQILAAGSSDCNPIPVPGTSNLYGLDYLTGTASTSLLGSFGSITGLISKSVSLGAGKSSSPVLHVSSEGAVTAAFGLSGGTKLQNIGTIGKSHSGEVSWREPVDNQ